MVHFSKLEVFIFSIYGALSGAARGSQLAHVNRQYRGAFFNGRAVAHPEGWDRVEVADSRAPSCERPVVAGVVCLSVINKFVGRKKLFSRGFLPTFVAWCRQLRYTGRCDDGGRNVVTKAIICSKHARLLWNVRYRW